MSISRNFKSFATILSLILIDLATFYFSLLSAYYSRKLLNFFDPAFIYFDIPLLFFLKLLWMPFVFILFLAYEKLYVKRLPFWDEAKEIVKAVTISMAVTLSVITLGKMTGEISRLVVLFLWAYSLFVFPFFRLIGKKIIYKSHLWKDNVIIIGAGRAGVETTKGINSETHLGYNVIGFLDDDERKIGSRIEIGGKSYKVFGKTKYFRKFIDMLDVSTVIIAIPSFPPEELSRFTNDVQKYAKRIFVIPDLKGIALLNTELQHLFMQQLFLMNINNNLKSPFNRFVKKTFDWSLSLLLLPLIAVMVGVIGVLIKLDSPGPVFFIQDRLGKNRRLFKCMKFRTMYENSDAILDDYLKAHPECLTEWEEYKKLRDYDPRVTRAGKFLRKTSLDELPQIFNILRGQMSLFGPRPYLPSEEEHMKDYADIILLTQPGITGLWQVSGRNELSFDERLKLDAWYVLNWSLWFDIVVLMKTVKVVLKREGAY